MKQFALCLASLVFFFSSAVAADTKIYHWVDEQGRNYFSDTAAPGQDVEELNISNQNLLFNNAAETQKAKQEDKTAVAVEEKQKQPLIYQASISSPKDDSAIRSNNGTLEIQVTILPEKESNQKLQLYLDGRALGAPQISSTIRALNVDRGTHQAQVHLLDENGKLLAKTQIVTLHLQRVTVNTGN